MKKRIILLLALILVLTLTACGNDKNTTDIQNDSKNINDQKHEPEDQQEVTNEDETADQEDMGNDQVEEFVIDFDNEEDIEILKEAIFDYVTESGVTGRDRIYTHLINKGAKADMVDLIDFIDDLKEATDNFNNMNEDGSFSEEPTDVVEKIHRDYFKFLETFVVAEDAAYMTYSLDNLEDYIEYLIVSEITYSTPGEIPLDFHREVHRYNQEGLEDIKDLADKIRENDYNTLAKFKLSDLYGEMKNIDLLDVVFDGLDNNYILDSLEAIGGRDLYDKIRDPKIYEAYNVESTMTITNYLAFTIASNYLPIEVSINEKGDLIVDPIIQSVADDVPENLSALVQQLESQHDPTFLLLNFAYEYTDIDGVESERADQVTVRVTIDGHQGSLDNINYMHVESGRLVFEDVSIGDYKLGMAVDNGQLYLNGITIPQEKNSLYTNERALPKEVYLEGELVAYTDLPDSLLANPRDYINLIAESMYSTLNIISEEDYYVSYELINDLYTKKIIVKKFIFEVNLEGDPFVDVKVLEKYEYPLANKTW